MLFPFRLLRASHLRWHCLPRFLTLSNRREHRTQIKQFCRFSGHSTVHASLLVVIGSFQRAHFLFCGTAAIYSTAVVLCTLPGHRSLPSSPSHHLAPAWVITKLRIWIEIRWVIRIQTHSSAWIPWKNLNKLKHAWLHVLHNRAWV